MTLHVLNDERGVVTLRLNDPDKRNAIDEDTMLALVAAVESAATDGAVRVIVIEGTGDHFCGGADIIARNVRSERKPRTGSIQRRLPVQAHRLIPLLCTVQVPVVCKVQGWAAGIGFQIALAADFTVATDDARFWEPFTQRGFTPDSGATWLLPRRVGEARARELLLPGRELSGAEAASWGAIHRAVPAAELDSVVDEIVDRLATGPTVALGLTKWLLAVGAGAEFETQLANEAFALELSSRSEDFREGISAFREKARPALRREMNLDRDTPAEVAVGEVRAWVEANVPRPWVEAGRRGGAAAVREVRPRAEYEAWYPVFAASGLAVPTWPVEYSGLDLSPAVARAVDGELRPFNLGRLNPLGLNNTAPALYSYGTEEQRLRFLPPMVRNEEKWCQLFSEPGAGSDLASLATRAVRDGDSWCITGQKVWSTWAHFSDFAILLARTDPDAPKRQGITYFLLDLHQPGVEVRPLRHIGGEVDFNEVFLESVLVPDAYRVGEVGQGWKVANATLSGERKMVSGAGAGGVDRIGGRGVEHLLELAAASGRDRDPVLRQELMRVLSEERIRGWTNQRVGAQVKAGRAPGPESSVGKVHQGALNQRIQLLATDLLGADAMAWPTIAGVDLPLEVRGMLRSRANTIEGGTTEVNKNIVGERVLGLPARTRSVAGFALARRTEELRNAVEYPRLETLSLERKGPVGWLINNRPDQLNAMNTLMRDEFEHTWRALDADPEVRVIVHTGAGRTFQTGVDVTEIATDGEGMQRYRQSVEDFDFHFTSWHNDVWKPVITAVNGICAGGGFHWVADADIVIAASDAQFFDPHTSIGQVVSIEAIGLMKKMPVEAVMRMAFVGRYERLSAQRAYELGMISEIVDPPGRLREAAQELGEKIARNSPAAMAATKRALWGALELGLTDACKAGAQELVSMWGHPDQEEGPRAFAEKRDAQWAPPTK